MHIGDEWQNYFTMLFVLFSIQMLLNLFYGTVAEIDTSSLPYGIVRLSKEMAVLPFLHDPALAWSCTIDSLIAGFGTRETKDCQNAVFISKELFNLDLPLEYKGMGRVGVECLRLYCILENGRHLKKNPKVSKIGQTLSQYSSHELMVMASYLRNEGRSRTIANWVWIY